MKQPIAETEGRSFDGGCHCGAIRFRVQGPLRQILMCHCSECGSQMFYRMDDRPLISIAPGAFDSSEILSVAGQVFRSSHPA